jgi:hypothetical protein
LSQRGYAIHQSTLRSHEVTDNTAAITCLLGSGHVTNQI